MKGRTKPAELEEWKLFKKQRSMVLIWKKQKKNTTMTMMKRRPWCLGVLTISAMECILKSSSSLKVTNNPFSCTLRPVIPQQIHNHSLSFKPHKARVEVKARRLESDLCFFVEIKMRLLGEITKSQAVILQCWVDLLRNCGKTVSGERVELLWYSQACVTVQRYRCLGQMVVKRTR